MCECGQYRALLGEMARAGAAGIWSCGGGVIAGPGDGQAGLARSPDMAPTCPRAGWPVRYAPRPGRPACGWQRSRARAGAPPFAWLSSGAASPPGSASRFALRVSVSACSSCRQHSTPYATSMVRAVNCASMSERRLSSSQDRGWCSGAGSRFGCGAFMRHPGSGPGWQRHC